jgi:LysM repeat protein
MENPKSLTLPTLNPNRFMKKIVLLTVCCIMAMAAIAQNKIIVQGSFPDIYIIHKTAGRESLTSISRLYNLSSTPAVQLNDIKEDGTVAAGKEVRIPLEKGNFTQDGQPGEGEVLLPLYHIVQKNENLFRISQLFGKVRIDFLREWNDMNNDVIQLGQKIIIGHLKVTKEKARDIVAATPSGTGTDNGNEIKGEKKDEPGKSPEPKKNDPTPSSNNDDNDEGFFVTLYPTDTKGNQQAIKTGTAATFKTTSGWSDRKYYVLMNDVVPGTIVRITGPSNKSVCAKVLGSLPDMKENSTLLIRMSNATASALRVTDAQFQVQVSFHK